MTLAGAIYLIAVIGYTISRIRAGRA